MSMVTGFPPICGDRPRALVLGSMPGTASLQAQQYYAHPRNAFWPIMQALFGIGADLAYAERCRLLQAHRIALWDVLKGCSRKGSLDSAIVQGSIEPNDLAGLLRDNPSIRAICFNGQMAEKAYLRHVLPGLSGNAADIGLHRLPSTSPANASWSFERKLAAWRVLPA